MKEVSKNSVVSRFNQASLIKSWDYWIFAVVTSVVRLLNFAVVTSVISQWPPAYGDQRMCTQVQPILWSHSDLKKRKLQLHQILSSR